MCMCLPIAQNDSFFFFAFPVARTMNLVHKFTDWRISDRHSSIAPLKLYTKNNEKKTTLAELFSKKKKCSCNYAKKESRREVYYLFDFGFIRK